LQALEPTARATFRDDLSAIVREAGAMAAGKFGGAFRHWTKGESSPVTEVDIAVDNFLRERLPRLAAAGWLSEETEDDAARLGASRVWIVDPIDGTRAFVSGRTDWAVSVALVEDGRPVAAALYSPLEDGLYLALAGEGATLDGTPIVVGTNTDLAHARVAGPKRRVDHLESSGLGIIAEPKIHSLALRLARVAAGRIDVAFAGPNSHDWDIAAADLVVHEAGGQFTTLKGERLSYNRTVPRHVALVATNSARHERVLAITREWS
jgi:myo-inositol-1(or 4)-monophosphatase